MGVQRTVALLVVLWVLAVGTSASPAKVAKRDYVGDGGAVQRLCDVPGCNCTSAAGGWKAINCTFTSSQRVVIEPGSVPPTTIELSIIGGAEITINAQSFHLFKAFNLLRIDGTGTLNFRRNAFDNLNSTLMILQVLNCDQFVLENHAFKNMQTPIRAEILRCRYVSVQNSAFSRLDEAKFEDIQQLELAEGAFTFEKQGDIGRHGPATNLSFQNVTIDKIPGGTFTSALAEVNIQNSEIRDIFPHAFKASQINAIFINSTTIHRLHSAALSDWSLVLHVVFSKCKIHVMEKQAFTAAISNLTVQFSIITEIKSAAINSSVTANIIISDNEIKTISPQGFIFNNWNRIHMENNIIVNLSENFLEVPYNGDVESFSFSGNEIYNAKPDAFVSIPELEYRMTNFRFRNNFFNKTCHCNMSAWLESLLHSPVVHNILVSNFCSVDLLLSRCFNINQGVINMKNFSELVCGPENVITCEPYNGETKAIDTTSVVLTVEREDSTNFIMTAVIIGVLIFAAIATVVSLLVKGGLWLRRKGYCTSYNQNNISNEDEGAMVTEDTSERFEFPGELSTELLQELREQLENPDTHEKARELIEKLYEQFIIIDDSYTNNNKQDEEAHLYEELGNMQSGNFDGGKPGGDGIVNYLKLMEEKLNLPLIDQDEPYKPSLVNEYSEPTDAAVHLYSELKNKMEEEMEKKGSIKSQASNGSKMAFRPLPEKPKDQAGPSSKY